MFRVANRWSLVDQGLELGNGAGQDRLGGLPLLHRLPEAFDCAAGDEAVWTRALLDDASKANPDAD